MYSINLLKDKDFDSLPYKDADISLGLADYKNKKAYVRESGIPALDLLVMGHEIQELVADVSPHEEDGIRYKKGGAARSIFPLILGALGTVIGGPVLGAVLGGLSGGGMGAYAGANHPQELGGPLQAGLWGAGTGALGGYGAGQMLAGGIAGGSAAAPGFMSKLGGIAEGAIMGTAGGGAQSLLGTTAGTAGRSVGLLGPGTLLGGMTSSTLGKLGATSAANTLLNNFNSQVSNTGNKAYNQQNTNDNFISSNYSGFNNSLPYSSFTQPIKPTPSLSGFSSSLMNSGFMGNNASGGSYADAIIPGMKYQPNLFTWR